MAILCDDTHKETALTAARNLLAMHKKADWPSEITGSLQCNLHKAQAAMTKHSRLSALQRRFFFRPAT